MKLENINRATQFSSTEINSWKSKIDEIKNEIENKRKRRSTSGFTSGGEYSGIKYGNDIFSELIDQHIDEFGSADSQPVI